MRRRAGGEKSSKKVPTDPKERFAATDNPVKLNKSRITDNGKPLERLGRKAEGLTRGLPGMTVWPPHSFSFRPGLPRLACRPVKDLARERGQERQAMQISNYETQRVLDHA